MPLRLKSLSTELTVVFASIAVALVGLVSYFAFDMVSRAQEETVQRDLLNTVDQAVTAIDGELQERVREVETITLSPAIRDAAIFLSEAHATIPVRERVEPAMRKRFAGATCLDERPEIAQHLRSVVSAHTYISQFLLTDRFGLAIGCTSTQDQLLHSGQTWWQEAMRRGRSLGNLERDPATGGYVYSVALPIPDGTREPAGVLRAIINLRGVQESMGSARIGDKGFLFVLSRDGRVIAHPDAAYLWKKVDEIPELAYLRTVVAAPGPRGMLMYERRPRVAGDPSGAPQSPVPNGVRPASLASASADTWLLGYSRIFTPASLGPLGWTVFGTVSRQEVVSPILAIRRHVVVVGGVFILLAVPFVWFVSRRLARPLNDLAYRANLIAAGDLRVGLAVPSRNEIGQLATALSSMVDSLRESNDSLTRTNLNLERLVADRTREVQDQNRKIEEQNRQVLEASRLKSQFLANMSHELRTPLNAVLALSEILGQRISGDLNDEQVKQVTIINRSGRNLLKLINDILDLSKIEAGRMEIHLGVMDLRNAMTAIRDTIEPLANEKGLALEVMVDPMLPPLVRSDDAKIRQILVNLLGNAVKFTEKGKVGVALSHRRRHLPGADEISARIDPHDPFWLELKVTDTGIGIPPEAQEKIFDEFQQADGSTTRKYGGSGLGLAISKKLAELLGGEISVESAVGRGSTFRVLVPAEGVRDHDAPAEEHESLLNLATTYVPAMPPASSSADPVNRPRLAEGKKRKFVSPFVEHPVPISPRFLDIYDDTDKLLPHIPTILVVDDDPESLYVYRQFLSRHGYQVIFAINGEQVMDKARQFRPVAIVLDLMLPQKSGWEVLEELKITEDLKDIPVIISSVLDHRERGVCAGAFRYLTKPMTEKQFLGVLKELEKIRKKDVRKVLVIDDDPVELGIARTLFEKAGLDVITMEDGPAAVVWAAAELPDIIVLDLLMPGVDGYEILSRLKSDPRTAHIPVMVYTAMDLSDADRARLIPAARRIFPKVPLQIEEMLDELQRALQSVPARADLPLPAAVSPAVISSRPSSSSPEFVAAPTRVRDGVAGSARRARILLVEDDAANQYSIGFILRAEGHEVLVAENGNDGVMLADRERPDLILMDMMMPVMSGFDATRLLKRSGHLKDIPVIALTAAAMAGDRERTLAAGCDDYISKPVNRAQLLERVVHWLAVLAERETVGVGR